jgi:hypothetical protein
MCEDPTTPVCPACGRSSSGEQEKIEQLPKGAAMPWQEMLKQGQAAFSDVPEGQLDRDLDRVTAKVKRKLDAQRQTQLPA